MTRAAESIRAAESVLIKIGSSLLLDDTAGEIRTGWLASLLADVKALKDAGKSVTLVSSGAIGLGWPKLGAPSRPTRLEGLQAAAAIGQISLAGAYRDSAREHGMTAAQMLLTLRDLEDRPSYLNARATLETLLAADILPVINENDTVATSEIRFGDNDRLAARLAGMARANLLILLSDVDGLYSESPDHNALARHIPLVERITDDIRSAAGPSERSGVGTGGMASKIEAAAIATEGGTEVLIANGWPNHSLKALQDGANATLFTANGSPLAVRKAWIRGLSSPRAYVHLDDGAVKAVRAGHSLLPVGVQEIAGDFARGDLIAIMGPRCDLVAQGIASMSDNEALRLIGKKMDTARSILGYEPRSSLVHRDDLVVL